ncbi:hypothetical protein SORBI_3001G369101 [Sorghum bicolor]|uniref:Uncharacterized protein n=1 Tax=Sorghum bicolor TaxID=4558 RepID=A0A1B6QPK1_SORBI|nr:hypothetical protein SORBI_3001G369101 [Sorghum bicolor]
MQTRRCEAEETHRQRCRCLCRRASVHPYHPVRIRAGIPLGDVGCCLLAVAVAVADRNPWSSITARVTRDTGAPASSARWYASSPSTSPPRNARRTRRCTSRDVSSCWSAISGPSARASNPDSSSVPSLGPPSRARAPPYGRAENWAPVPSSSSLMRAGAAASWSSRQSPSPPSDQQPRSQDSSSSSSVGWSSLAIRSSNARSTAAAAAAHSSSPTGTRHATSSIVSTSSSWPPAPPQRYLCSTMSRKVAAASDAAAGIMVRDTVLSSCASSTSFSTAIMSSLLATA